MTAQELKTAQENLTKKIYDFAEQKKLSNEELEPITDGVCNESEYLNSNPKIMWILKRPYDDVKEDGTPKGGDWSIVKDCFRVKDDVWKNKTFQPIIYSSYGFVNNLRYNGMDYIRDDKSMADILGQIAFINIDKMPGNNCSSEIIGQTYETWKEILWEQIDLYKPDVIIFGNTFDFFKEDMVGSETEPLKKYSENSIEYIHAYKKGSQLLLNAYSPRNKVPGSTKEAYVNLILDAIHENYK